MNAAPLLLLAVVVAQGSGTHVPDPSRQFDFWIGTWSCKGESHGPKGNKTTTVATNSVTLEYGGHVVHEHFKMSGLNGTSFSVYDPRAKLWRQTWVDDQGAYIALTGVFRDGKMILQTLPRPGYPKAASRMVYSNISKDSFDWYWESTQDGGQDWTLAWHLHYTRIKEKGLP